MYLLPRCEKIRVVLVCDPDNIVCQGRTSNSVNSIQLGSSPISQINSLLKQQIESLEQVFRSAPTLSLRGRLEQLVTEISHQINITVRKKEQWKASKFSKNRDYYFQICQTLSVIDSCLNSETPSIDLQVISQRHAHHLSMLVNDLSDNSTKTAVWIVDCRSDSSIQADHPWIDESFFATWLSIILSGDMTVGETIAVSQLCSQLPLYFTHQIQNIDPRFVSTPAASADMREVIEDSESSMIPLSGCIESVIPWIIQTQPICIGFPNSPLSGWNQTLQATISSIGGSTSTATRIGSSSLNAQYPKIGKCSSIAAYFVSICETLLLHSQPCQFNDTIQDKIISMLGKFNPSISLAQPKKKLDDTSIIKQFSQLQDLLNISNGQDEPVIVARHLPLIGIRQLLDQSIGIEKGGQAVPISSQDIKAVSLDYLNDHLIDYIFHHPSSFQWPTLFSMLRKGDMNALINSIQRSRGRVIIGILCFFLFEVSVSDWLKQQFSSAQIVEMLGKVYLFWAHFFGGSKFDISAILGQNLVAILGSSKSLTPNNEFASLIKYFVEVISPIGRVIDSSIAHDNIQLSMNCLRRQEATNLIDSLQVLKIHYFLLQAGNENAITVKERKNILSLFSILEIPLEFLFLKSLETRYCLNHKWTSLPQEQIQAVKDEINTIVNTFQSAAWGVESPLISAMGVQSKRPFTFSSAKGELAWVLQQVEAVNAQQQKRMQQFASLISPLPEFNKLLQFAISTRLIDSAKSMIVKFGSLLSISPERLSQHPMYCAGFNCISPSEYSHEFMSIFHPIIGHMWKTFVAILPPITRDEKDDGSLAYFHRIRLVRSFGFDPLLLLTNSLLRFSSIDVSQLVLSYGDSTNFSTQIVSNMRRFVQKPDGESFAKLMQILHPHSDDVETILLSLEDETTNRNSLRFQASDRFEKVDVLFTHAMTLTKDRANTIILSGNQAKIDGFASTLNAMYFYSSTFEAIFAGNELKSFSLRSPQQTIPRAVPSLAQYDKYLKESISSPDLQTQISGCFEIHAIKIDELISFLALRLNIQKTSHIQPETNIKQTPTFAPMITSLNQLTRALLGCDLLVFTSQGGKGFDDDKKNVLEFYQLIEDS